MEGREKKRVKEKGKGKEGDSIPLALLLQFDHCG